MKPANPARADPQPLQLLGALALELKGTAPVARAVLSQGDVGALADLVAGDLNGFSPDAARLDLILVGAHYDPVEMLRPGWPLHHELDELAARAPKEVPLGGAPKEVPLGGAPKEVPLGGAPNPHPDLAPRRDARQPGRPGGEPEHLGRVIAFGAHAGQLPGSLMPSADFSGGPLRLVPFVLRVPRGNRAAGGDAATVIRVGEIFERELLERGMAGAATALAAQAAFGLQVEHARYLTVHDLTAMMAMQYDHAGLAPLWPLLETALLQPDDEQWLDAAPEPLLHYTAGEVRIALFSPNAWHARYANQAPCDNDEQRNQLDRQHQHFEARQRQFAAVLGAHGVAVTFVHCDGDADYRNALS